MPTSQADLITQPLRARILIHLMGRELTTNQLARLLPEVPRASLYRHVRRLLEGGVLEVVREIPVRGTLEKVYAVRRDAGQIPAADVESATPADHLRHFASFQETMAAAYRAYLESGPVNPPGEVMMVATPLHLSAGDYDRFREELRKLIHSFQDGDRNATKRRVLWLLSIPDRADVGTPEPHPTEDTP
jgi:DNA-binding transcriptional ArsR family regulator